MARSNQQCDIYSEQIYYRSSEMQGQVGTGYANTGESIT